MGMDCHLHIEVKLQDRWEHYEKVSVDRDYELFEKMSESARWNSGKQLSRHLGLPSDMNSITKLFLEQVDCHSHHWMDKRQVLRLHKWMQQNSSSGQAMHDIVEELALFYKKEFPIFRLVYAFDN